MNVTLADLATLAANLADGHGLPDGPGRLEARAALADQLAPCETSGEAPDVDPGDVDPARY